MRASVLTIKVRISARETLTSKNDARQQFWSALREGTDYSNYSISQLEGQLCRRFGEILRNKLVVSIRDGLNVLIQSSGRDILDMIEGRWHPREFEYSPGWSDLASKLIEQRTELLRGNRDFQLLQDRLAAASELVFSTRLLGYSSLNLEVLVGNVGKLAKAFDNNFEYFRVFLDAFVPDAFGDVFDDSFADLNTFQVELTESAHEAFESAAEDRRRLPNTWRFGRRVRARSAASNSDAGERADWLRRLVNGSLIIPLFISAAFMYYGLKIISEIRESESRTLIPILNHQIELLREDRLRFTNQTMNPRTSIPGDTLANRQ